MKLTAAKLLLLPLLWLLPSFAFAQVSLSFSDIEVEPGALFETSVRTSNFNNIISAQFSMKWDPTVIRYDGITAFGIPGLAIESNFGTTNTAAGLLSFLWFDANLQGVSLPNDAPLFTIRFEVIGSPLDTSALQIWNMPASIEIANINSMVLPTVLTAGTVTVLNPLGTFSSAPHKVRVQEARPNPFSDATTVAFELSSPSHLQLQLLDAQGRVVFTEQRTFAAGLHSVALEKDRFPAPGLYYYQIIGADFRAVQKLLLNY